MSGVFCFYGFLHFFMPEWLTYYNRDEIGPAIVNLSIYYYLRNKNDSALLPSNLPSVIDRSNLSPSREAAM